VYWAGSVTITNFRSGVIHFGDDSSGLSATELAAISVVGVGGAPLSNLTINATGALEAESVGTLFDAWMGGFGLSGTNAAATNDYDGDLWSNLEEYGLDGDPTNSAVVGTVPEFTYNGSSMEFVHGQRSDDSSLVYYLETTPNLVNGIWTNDNYTVDGTNVTGLTLNMVTNFVPTTDDEMFIRLVIEQN